VISGLSRSGELTNRLWDEEKKKLCLTTIQQIDMLLQESSANVCRNHHLSSPSSSNPLLFFSPAVRRDCRTRHLWCVPLARLYFKGTAANRSEAKGAEAELGWFPHARSARPQRQSGCNVFASASVRTISSYLTFYNLRPYRPHCMLMTSNAAPTSTL
jgi:hypothetical protein